MIHKTCDACVHGPGGNVCVCSLNTLHIGSHGTVVSIDGDQDLRRRLLEMGFCNGASVECVRRAPLGDPIEYRLRGYHLSLRSDQASHVQVNVPQKQGSPA